MIAKPFLKWAGGKRQILPELLKYVPEKFETYIEPFVGGGAMFFALAPRIKKAILTDSNERLIAAYKGVQSYPDKVILILEAFKRRYLKAKDRESCFYEIRDEIPDLKDQEQAAAWMIFMNKTCFNGLYRVNKKGLFNVPHGKYDNPSIVDSNNIIAASMALSKASIYSQDFRETMKEAKPGDFVYLDPPYIPRSDTSYFTSYTKQGFGPSDQKDLAALADSLRLQKVHVVASGSGAKETETLYKKNFTLTPIFARRSINADAFGRDGVKEYVIHSYGSKAPSIIISTGKE
jgi:DNA adenine methylase